MNKYKAAILHLLISVFVMTIFLLFVYYVWYEQIYAEISGVINPVKLLILIDVILGPILTFIVYKKDKKTLKFDLGMIILLQIAAFIYGGYTLYIGKPSIVVMRLNSFEIIIQKHVNESELNSELQQAIGFFSGPQFAYIPNDQVDMNRLSFAQQNNILPVNLDHEDLQKAQIDQQQVLSTLKLNEDQLTTSLNEMSTTTEQVSFYTLLSVDGKYASLVVDSTSYKAIGVVMESDSSQNE